jgi:nitrate reductase gamma subunit
VPDGLRRGASLAYRYAKFGWTTTSSQLYENPPLRLGSLLFHFGVLLLLGGHLLRIRVIRGLRVGLPENADQVE